MTTETAQQTATPPAHAPAYVAQRALYCYGVHAYVTFGGRLITTATIGTPSQEARIEALFARLAGQRMGPV